MNNGVRKITDGAMMAAIMGVVLFLNRQTAGMLEASFLFLFPLPMVFYGAKYGWRDSWMVFFAILFLAFILATPASMILAASESLIGMIYGCGIHNRTDGSKLLVRTILGAVVVDLVSMVLFAKFFGYDFNADVASIKNMLDQMAGTMNTDPAIFSLVEMYIKPLVIASVILTGVIEGFATHMVSRLLLYRLKFKVDPPKPFWLSVPPKWTGYVGIASYVAMFYVMRKPFENDMVNSVIFSLGMVFSMFLLLFGCICVNRLIKKYIPGGGVLSLLLLPFLFVTANFLLVGLGYFYITTPLRERLAKGGLNARSAR